MRQVDPVFASTHDRATVAALLGIKASDVSDEGLIQTVSTGRKGNLPFESGVASYCERRHSTVTQ
ncbi:MAG TPA: hypothetical protein VIE42_12525 [Steroidobacteraceae bacterium]|jgi:predicted PhzF superfamily epimerase YddE/YHI9